MIYSQKELEEKLKKKEMMNFYLFYGEEKFFVKSFIKRILEAISLENFREFNLKAMSCDDFSFEVLEDFLNMPPVLLDKKIFILKDFPILKFNSGFVERLKKIFANVPEYFIFILVVESNVLSFRKSAFFKKFMDMACLVEFPYKTEDWLFKKILQSVKKNGFDISEEDLIFFIRRVGRSIEQLKIELDKIFSFVLKGKIKREDILNLTARNIEENAFNITKNLLINKKQEAIQIFNELKKAGVNESLIFGAISCCFVDLYRAKIAKQNNVKVSEILKFYDYRGKEFRIKNAYLNCEKFSIERLKKLVVSLSHIDVFMKTKNFSKELLLERFLFSV